MLGENGILRRCAMENGHDAILYETHEGIDGGHNVGKEYARKLLHVGL